jgi:hypothetical protein
MSRTVNTSLRQQSSLPLLAPNSTLDSHSNTFIILMADVIGSSKMVKAELEIFFDVVEEVNSRHEKELVSMLTVTLGDEFQAVVKDIRSLIAIIIDLEESLLRRNSSILLRYVAYRGAIDSTIHHQRAHAMVGSGLTNARKRLELLKKSEFRFDIDLGDPLFDMRLQKTLVVWGSFLEHWKEKEKHMQFAPLFLENVDYKAVALSIHADRGNVWRMEKSLRFKEYLAQRDLLQMITT